MGLVRLFGLLVRSGCSSVQVVRLFGRVDVACWWVAYVFVFIGWVPRLWVRQFFPCAGFSGCRVVVYGEIYFIMSLC